MPLYSNSPLGLVLTSESTDSPVVGKYNLSDTSPLKSIFLNGASASSYSFNPRAGSSTRTDYNSDISTLSIIRDSEKVSAMRLRYSDFAYLKNLGVYPNNRLIIARRFTSPVGDDLTMLQNNTYAMSTLISWVGDNENFIETEFGENWVDGESSFKEILNELGHDVLMGDNAGKGLGGVMAGAINAVPLPGFTEGLQYQLFKNLGMTDLDASQLPVGNPNLIREAMRRKTLGGGEKGSGLKCKFRVKMEVEYEQKFINGVDPTVVYYDIIANALTFGTSESQFQFKGNVGNKFQNFINDMGSGDSSRIKSALLQFVSAIADALNKVGQEIINSIKETAENAKKAINAATNGDKKTQQTNDQSDKQTGVLSSAFGNVKKIITTIVTGLVNKYKLRIISVINSLTGTPSAPWHVTIGNPRRPIFSSGDMLVEDVTITMGKLLAFNDLPSSIKLSFTLNSARNVGAQEIFQKFNCGKERTYVRSKISFVDSNTTFTKEQLSDAQSTLSQNQNIAKIVTKSKITVEAGETPTQLQTDEAGKNAYPPALQSLPGVSFTNFQSGDGNFYSAPSATLSQLPDNVTQPVTFTPDGRLLDKNNSYLGNWQSNGKNVDLNLNNNSTGKKQITLPGQ